MSNRLGSIKPKEFIRRMKKAGFRVDRQTGSHIVLINASGRRLVVPSHVKEMKRGLLFGLIKQSGLTMKEFQKI